MKQILKYPLLVCIIFLLISCNGDSNKPDQILSEDKMVNILIKIHLTEAKISNSLYPSDSALIYYKSMEDSIYHKMGIPKKDYTESYIYYMRNIEQMDRIYSRVIDSLSLREALRNIKY